MFASSNTLMSSLKQVLSTDCDPLPNKMLIRSILVRDLMYDCTVHYVAGLSFAWVRTQNRDEFTSDVGLIPSLLSQQVINKCKHIERVEPL